MKRFKYLILIVGIVSFSCSTTKKENKSLNEFKCSFEGDIGDISSFLGRDIRTLDKITLKYFSNNYLFSEKEPLVLYVYDRNSKILETLKLEEISTQLKTHRKFEMHLTDSTKNGFTLSIKSRDNLTKMTKDIIIKCSKG